MEPKKNIDFYPGRLWHIIMHIYSREAAKLGGTMSVRHALLIFDNHRAPSNKLSPKRGMESRSLTRDIKSKEDNGLIPSADVEE